MKYLIPFLALAFFACAGSADSNLSDSEKMEQSVQSYLFLGDSIDVETTIIDTILVEELDALLDQVEENLNLVQQDIDTLEEMIDTLAYDNLEVEQSVMLRAIGQDRYLSEKAVRDMPLMEYKLKMAELISTKMVFLQSKRVMLQLRRAQLSSVAGYEVAARYQMAGEKIELGFLMNSKFRIID